MRGVKEGKKGGDVKQGGETCLLLKCTKTQR
jgi:hypothetical protein